MRIYSPGEKVALQDDRIATVVETHEEQYDLPEGMILGAGEATADNPVKGGTAWYMVKVGSGRPFRATDREVRNPPSDKGGTYTALRKKLESAAGGKQAHRDAAPQTLAGFRGVQRTIVRAPR